MEFKYMFVTSSSIGLDKEFVMATEISKGIFDALCLQYGTIGVIAESSKTKYYGLWFTEEIPAVRKDLMLIIKSVGEPYLDDALKTYFDTCNAECEVKK